MKSIFSLILILTTVVGTCQSLDKVSVHNNITVGKNFISDTALTATQYVFMERIHDFHVNQKNNMLNVQLRERKKDKYLHHSGFMFQYDLLADATRWTKNLFYGKYNDIYYFENQVFILNGLKSRLINYKTGEEIFSVKKNVNHVNNKLGIGIAYSYTSNVYKNTLYGISLKTGEELWEREINKDFNWNSFEYLNDSTLLIASSGLHTINLKTGEGWDYNTATGRNDIIRKTGTSVAGHYFNTLHDVYMKSSTYVVGGVVSNVVNDQEAYYLASMMRLAKVDKNTGQVIWANPYSKKLGSKSNIYLSDSLLLVVNMGHASIAGKSSEFGKTFIAAFSKQSGEQKFINFINTTTDKVILASNLVNNELVLLFEDNIAKYSLTDGQLITEKTINIESSKVYAHNFVSDNIFVKTDDNKYVQINQIDSLNLCVRTHEKVIIFNNDLSIKETLTFDMLAVRFYENKNYAMLCANKQIIVIDTMGRALANFDLPFETNLINNQIYNGSDGRHYIFDTSLLIWLRNYLITFKITDDTFYLSSDKSIFKVDLSLFSNEK